MDLNDLRSLVTLTGFLLFLGLLAWTWWPTRRAAHDAAARLPFADDLPADDATRASAVATPGAER